MNSIDCTNNYPFINQTLFHLKNVSELFIKKPFRSTLAVAAIICTPLAVPILTARSMLAVAAQISTLPAITLLAYAMPIIIISLTCITFLACFSVVIVGHSAIWLVSEINKIATRKFNETHQYVPGVENDPRKIMLILHSTYDHNGAFEQIRTGEMLTLEKNYRIVHNFITSKDDFRSALESITEKIDVLWVKAHGRSSSIRLGSNERLSEPELVDFSDVFKEKLSDMGTIILQSCSTAGSRDGNDLSFARRVASVAPGRTVYAPIRSTNLYRFQKDGKLNIRYHHVDDEKTNTTAVIRDYPRPSAHYPADTSSTH